MVAALDITGDRYGRLVAICRVPKTGKATRWRFRCDCGAEVETAIDRVRSGVSRSCGCLRAEQTAARSRKHGHSINLTRGGSQSRTLKAWQHAKQRCFNPRDAKFPNYGGRGISMCERWRADFREFLADMGECPPGRTLDRINVHGNYEPGNCRWATSHEQARTRTDNVLVEHDGQVMVLKDFAALVGVNYKALHSRVRYRGERPQDAARALLMRR